ncbi:MAG: 50S ribosomal protein L21 [Bacteroidota bacterium]
MSDSSNLIAFITTGNKQFKAQVGSTLMIDKRENLSGTTITFDRVLLVIDGDNTYVGQPYLEGACVIGEVHSTIKDEKVVVFKKKRRKGYKVKRGHRQPYTQVTIKEIITS